MDFRDYLVSAYCENPCQVLPNALWKTLAHLEQMQTSFKVQEGSVVELKVANQDMMMAYWTRSREPFQDSFQQHETLKMALVHQDYLHTFPYQRFSVRRPYFRLVHRQGETPSQLLIPRGFSIVAVNIQREYEQVAHFIGQCYENTQLAASTVMGWSQHPVFEPALWIWVFDDINKVRAGLGIAEFDAQISEGSLEWIQLLPPYRRQGLGKVIVQELLSRLAQQARFTTVAGEINNRTNPEALYRSCGFKGDDIWWMLGSG